MPAAQNSNPIVYSAAAPTRRREDDNLLETDDAEAFDQQEIFDLVRSITDPEHPLTLEQLNVTQLDHITVNDAGDCVAVEFTPTIPHCSMATLIGLCITVKLLRALPTRFKIAVRIRAGTHQSEEAVNKQLSDKERVAAALENEQLLGVVNKCLESTFAAPMA